jgi:enoyl-CoA hydratase/carnithine racemase
MDIIVAQKAEVTTVTLNRPAAMNAITPDMHNALQAAFDAFAADDTQRICVIKGAGERAFCAGSDLKTVDQQGAYPSSGYAGLIERYDLNKPLIAAVNGLALGGGFEIALACDIIVASETASFGLPEPLAGVVALGGGLHRLPRQIGLKQAMGMILTGQSVDAAQAESLGLVNQVVAPEALDGAVETWCEATLRASPMAVRASKQTVMRGLEEPSLAAALQNQAGYPAYRDWAQSDDMREGPRAFAEKRKPKWQV